MEINLIFFITFMPLGLILVILALIMKNRDKKMLRQCNEIVKGKVIKYTLYENGGVHFPIIEYEVNNTRYTQKLKYGWIITKSSSFNKVKTEVECDITDENLVISKNAHISINILREKFPIGTELDVFYNPQNPKKSYVMRFVKNPVIKVFYLVGLFFVILSFIGLAF